MTKSTSTNNVPSLCQPATVTEFPVDDQQFTDTTINTVTAGTELRDGWSISRADNWSFHVPYTDKVVPKVGMHARFYGKGIGYSVRGLFLNGIAVFYSTEEEFKLNALKETYGENIQEWLKRWDSGLSVWSISMSKFGPGYEQALQVCMVEMVRICIAEKFDASKWSDEADAGSQWRNDREVLDKKASAVTDSLGLSGNQFGAAMGLATKLYQRGPIAIMSDPNVESRHIQIGKSFPDIYVSNKDATVTKSLLSPVTSKLKALDAESTYMVLILMGPAAKVFKTSGAPSRKVRELATLVIQPGDKSAVKDRFGLYTPEQYPVSTDAEILEFFQEQRERLEQLDSRVETAKTDERTTERERCVATARVYTTQEGVDDLVAKGWSEHMRRVIESTAELIIKDIEGLKNE